VYAGVAYWGRSLKTLVRVCECMCVRAYVWVCACVCVDIYALQIIWKEFVPGALVGLDYVLNNIRCGCGCACACACEAVVRKTQVLCVCVSKAFANVASFQLSLIES